MRVRVMRDAGDAVREARLRRGWTQQRLADEARVGREWVSALERGKATLDMGRWLDVVDALGLSVEVHDDA